MKIESRLESHGSIAVLRPVGRMDLGHIAALDEAVHQHRQKGVRKFVLELTDVTDISSTGIGRIFGLHQDLEMNGGRLVLADLSQVVEYVLDLARMDDVFKIFPRVDDAVQELERRRL